MIIEYQSVADKRKANGGGLERSFTFVDGLGKRFGSKTN
jgi:hypothetical protein